MNLRPAGWAVVLAFRHLLAASRVGAARLVLLGLLFCTLLLLLVWSSLGARRSFLVEADTAALSLRFSTSGTAWPFDALTVCRRREVPDLGAPAGEGPCATSIYGIETVKGAPLMFPKGLLAEVSLGSAGELLIRVEDGGTDALPDGTLVVVDAPSLGAAGALPFVAELTLGAQLSAGQRAYLKEGRWEAREDGLASGWFGGGTEVVKSGDLTRGSTATPLLSDVPVAVFGHITPMEEDTAVKVVALTPPGDTALRITYFGTDRPTIVRPDWMDSALASPLLLALAAVLSVLASMMQVLADLGGLLAKSVKRGLRRASG